tara:strand:+ start:9035 stop:9442 length:408 start_codon:yes stop_codon:yes gene_type:complete
MWLVIRAVLIGLLFWSCGAKYHLNRAIAKDPQILDSVALKVDTLIITQKEEVRDTLILEKVDTITLERNGIRIDLRRVYDTIEVDVQCPSDTIRIQKEIKVPQLIYQEKNFDRKYLYILIISIILYTFGLIKLLK